MQLASPPRGGAATARYYSLRRLSPYQGTVQVVELPGFRAMSADGVAWELRLENAGARPTRSVWREGGPFDIVLNEHNEPFLAALRERPPLPFALADTLELWLLDAWDGQPLALLAAILPHMAPPNTVDSAWSAAFVGDDRFVAPSLLVAGQPATHVDPRLLQYDAASHPADATSVPPAPFIAHREVLNRCVRRAAGARPRAQWFRRELGGEGVGLHGVGIERDWIERRLAPAAFPELLLRETWDSPVEVNLVRDYHDWLAPLLLTHSNIRRATRDRLERAACRQAEKLYRLRQLLPEVVNSDLIEVALVEAMLRAGGASSAR